MYKSIFVLSFLNTAETPVDDRKHSCCTFESPLPVDLVREIHSKIPYHITSFNALTTTTVLVCMRHCYRTPTRKYRNLLIHSPLDRSLAQVREEAHLIDNSLFMSVQIIRAKQVTKYVEEDQMKWETIEQQRWGVQIRMG